MVSRQRGARSNRELAPELRDLALKLVRGQYADFGPTLAHEKLVEVHGIPISRTTVRKWMIGDGVWTTRRERNKRVYQPRYRRACVGELVQIDGCDHHWFEGRGPRCTDLVYIDDATGRLMELYFARSKNGCVTQGAIVENKVLAPALREIQRQQAERASQGLGKKRLTLRDEDLLRKSLGDSGLPTRRAPGRPTIREVVLARLASESPVVDGLIEQAISRLALPSE